MTGSGLLDISFSPENPEPIKDSSVEPVVQSTDVISEQPVVKKNCQEQMHDILDDMMSKLIKMGAYDICVKAFDQLGVDRFNTNTLINCLKLTLASRSKLRKRIGLLSVLTSEIEYRGRRNPQELDSL